MKNQFTKVMADKTNEELIEIVTVDKNKYQAEALEAAIAEISFRNIDTVKMEAVAKKFTKAKAESDSLEAVWASSATRFANCVIDSVIFFFVFFFFVNMITFFRFSGLGNGIVSWTLLFGWPFFYYGFMEYHFQKTFAKMMTRTTVLMTDGTKPSKKDIFIRTICRLIPFDNFSYLFAKSGFHDKFSNTIVVKDAR
ncbi:hypothetical protein FNO01nite_02810 [Flavobacterium noncentrifugens]|uniref:Uncharacterized membrane protein YckC, RDD family n=1 Tax=Flavobacterium noncentrifugens TaxID=1128970 RepID=A0A1G8RXK9_9FLAO|nr:RDD family protein [Flavobacterium noncentrifugens]GEP49609.1 hypothetical protein FNO01nite_02810 [Flavobacterium noncentrifugens]SDJ21285.1 Uncharacterized membrane protein YckC, RDD family [Flavobacterium noncentrifugens]